MLRSSSHARRGWSLIELLTALVVIGVLATLAGSGYQSQLRKARRADGHAALARLQQAQEQRRSQRPTYAASLDADGLDLPTTSGDGHYTLATSVDPASSASAYRVSAAASGLQTADTDCRHLAIEAEGGHLRWRSGPTAELGNTGDANRRCWNR